jgi:hypothetical protein
MYNNSITHDNLVNFDSDSKEIIIDTGASATFTMSKSDFISYTPYKGKVQGLGAMRIIGKGTVRYHVLDDNGNKIQILISNAYHIPTLPIRLISPQQLAQQSRDPLAGAFATKKDLILSWDFHCKTVKYNKANNLPMLYTEPGGSNTASLLAQHNDPFPSLYAHRHALPFPSIIEDNNINDKETEPTNQSNNN